MTDQQKYGDTQRIQTKREPWGYSYQHTDGEVFSIWGGGGDTGWYVEDSTGNQVAEGQTKKEAVISLQHHLNI